MLQSMSFENVVLQPYMFQFPSSTRSSCTQSVKEGNVGYNVGFNRTGTNMLVLYFSDCFVSINPLKCQRCSKRILNSSFLQPSTKEIVSERYAPSGSMCSVFCQFNNQNKNGSRRIGCTRKSESSLQLNVLKLPAEQTSGPY